MNRNLFLDIAERTFWTAAVAFLGPLVASPVFDNFGAGWQDALKVSVFATLGTLAKAAFAASVNRSSGGQLLPGEGTVVVKPEDTNLPR